ncbi:MAG: T9SS type A sorting domain-containing protein [Flavobacteriales bacterium]|nr:T9SS type A sorting domain-containing protein [Flavobacteriales bacterium]
MPQSQLYFTGFADTLCGPETANVFTFDGQQAQPWAPFAQVPPHTGNYTAWVFDLHGKTYVTGLYLSPLTGEWTSMMRYDHATQQWEAVPGWNTMGAVKDFTIRNDTLWLCGAFREATGGPADLVVGYDGEQWIRLGTGLAHLTPANGAALNLEWYRDELWVCGAFHNAGGIPVDRLAKWNGNQWCRPPGTFSSAAYLSDLAVWRDSLYVCGGLTTIDGVTMNGVAQWIGGDAVEECSEAVSVPAPQHSSEVVLHPNPVTQSFFLSGLPAHAAQVVVTDLAGRPVLHRTASLNSIEVGRLSPGLYLVMVLDRRGGRLAASRFVKE